MTTLTDTPLLQRLQGPRPSPKLDLCQGKYDLLESEEPILVQQSKVIFRSLLAVSVVSLAWKMISRIPPPETDAVQRVLLRDYQHYNKASERMRDSIRNLSQRTWSF